MGRDERDDLAAAEVASRYRTEAAQFRARARELHAAARALELTAADVTSLATSIERDLRGIDPLPPVGLS